MSTYTLLTGWSVLVAVVLGHLVALVQTDDGLVSGVCHFSLILKRLVSWDEAKTRKTYDIPKSKQKIEELTQQRQLKGSDFLSGKRAAFSRTLCNTLTNRVVETSGDI